MRKETFILFSSLLLFVLSPTVALGETEEKPRGLIGGVVKTLNGTLEGTSNTLQETTEVAGNSLDSIVEETKTSLNKVIVETVSYTEGTIEDVSSPVENDVITSTVNRTNEFVGNTVNHTLPVVEEAVKGTNKTVKISTSGVVDTVHEAAETATENLPEVPVVTPVVTEVNETVKKVTDQVQEVVNKTGASVEETIETVPEVVNDAVEKVNSVTESPVTEGSLSDNDMEITVGKTPVANENSNPKEPEKENQEWPVTSEEVDTPVIADSNSPTEAENEVAIPQTIIDNDARENNFSVAITRKATGNHDQRNVNKGFSSKTESPSKKQKTVSKSVNHPKPSPFPNRGESSTKNEAVANGSSTGTVNVFTAKNNHWGTGILTNLVLIEELKRMLCYQQHQFAMNQWNPSPLREPPKVAPFLNVV